MLASSAVVALVWTSAQYRADRKSQAELRAEGLDPMPRNIRVGLWLLTSSAVGWTAFLVFGCSVGYLAIALAGG